MTTVARVAQQPPRPDRPGRPHRGVTAVLLATAPADGGGSIAELQLFETTLLAHLVTQLQSLGVERIELITRPQWTTACTAVLGGTDGQVTVHATDSPADDLRRIAEIAAAVRGRVIVALADIATHREALAALLADPRIPSGILITGKRRANAFLIRSSRGRVTSASSAYHSVHRPNGYFLGVLKIDGRDRASLVRIAATLADLVDRPGLRWVEEMDRKCAVRRRSAARRVAFQAQREAGVAEPRLDPDLDLAAEPLDDETTARLARGEQLMRADVTSLLLVGLVREGVTLRNSYLRELYWRRPLTPAAARETSERMAQYDEDKVLLDSAVKGADGFFTTFFVSPYSRYIARWAARRGWQPNQVTVLSLALGAAAAAAFATGARAGMVAGAVLLQAAFTFDCVDGQLARYTRQFSSLGAWLDAMCDRAKEYLVFAGLAIGSSRGFGDDVWALAGAAMMLQTVRHTLVFSYAGRQHQLIETAPRLPLEQPGDLPSSRSVLDDDGAAANEPVRRPLRAVMVRVGRVPKQMSRRVLTLSGRLDQNASTRWLKKILVLPIGERFALISVAAACWTPRATFVLLLAWGGLAAAYSTTGAALRSFR